MKRMYILPCSVLLLLVAVALTQAAVLHTTLENGLTVLIDENHTNPVVSVQVLGL